MSKTLKEAKKYVKEGDEALKTGLFKWSKDYASAAVNYEEAAKIYRLAQEYDAATHVYEKLVDVNEKMNDSWAVARNYEAIVTMSIERKDGVIPASEPLVKWTTKAGAYFRMANSHNSYIGLVKKVAKFLDDQGQLVDAMNLFKSLLNDLEDDEQLHLRSEIVTAYAQLLVKVRRYPECIALFEREYTLRKNQNTDKKKNFDTLALTIIALYLIMEDVEKAEKKLQDFAIEIQNFIKTPEFEVSEKMVEAYIDGKQEDFNKSAQRTIVNNIFPLNIIKELRNVKVKACPEKRKVINLDDGIGMSSNIQSSGNNMESDFFQNSSNQGSIQPVVNEEQRQKDIDDFLC